MEKIDLQYVVSAKVLFTSQDLTTAKGVPIRRGSVRCAERKSWIQRIISKPLCRKL